MTTAPEQTSTIWQATADVPSRPPLLTDARADVCIIGAGIAGLTTAYLLAKQGLKVIVLERGQVGSGETIRTTAHLSFALDDRYTELERLHGHRGARLAAESHQAAVDAIEQIVRDEGIDCAFERLPGYLFLAPGHDPSMLDKERDAAHRAGLTDVERLARAPVDGFESGPCLRFPRQGQFHAGRYLAGLLAAAERLGVKVYAGTSALDVKASAPTAAVHTQGGAIVSAASVVVATNTPINDRLVIHAKQAPYRTYVVAASLPRGSVGRALYWDTGDPYHYVRLYGPAFGPAGHDLLIVGGEDHKTGQDASPETHWARLEEWTRANYPSVIRFEARWSGQVLEPHDGMAFIGRNPADSPNVYIATGDSGHGMTHGTIAGILLTDLIRNQRNPWESLYDPRRVTLRAAGELARENANVAVQYTDHVRPAEVRSADEIARGQGAVLRRGLLKIAAYRDDQGALHERSAVCPHLGCVVGWNSAESSWDCPCHGSRFDALGKVLCGPANSDLAEADQTDERPHAPPSQR